MTPLSAAIVLAAGAGSRMRRAAAGAELSAAQRAVAESGLKGMMPDSAGRPFLDHVVSSLADAGITDLCFIIGGHHQPIVNHYRNTMSRIRIAFATQPEPIGTANAVLAAEEWVGDRPFLVLNSDNLYPHDALSALVNERGPACIAFDRDALIAQSNIEESRVNAFATLTLDADDNVTRIVEKPEGPILSGAWISMNLWRFDERIWKFCRDVVRSPRGEYELPVAIGDAISAGMPLHAVKLHAGVFDLSRQDDVAVVARELGKRRVAL